MTLHSVVGTLATWRGNYLQHHPALGPQPGRCGAHDYLDRQPRPLPILRQHDPDVVLGEIVYLERCRSAGGLLAVGVVDSDHGLDPEQAWFSPGYRAVPLNAVSETAATMFEVSLLPHEAATIGAGRARFSTVDIRNDGGGAPHDLPLAWHDVWGRAHQAVQPWTAYRRADHLAIADPDLDRVLAHQRNTRAANPPPRRRPLSRADAAETAARADAAGYGYDAPDGRRVRVHAAGRVLG